MKPDDQTLPSSEGSETQQASPDEILKLVLQGNVIRLPLDVLPTFLTSITSDYKIKVLYNETEALILTEETERRLDAEAAGLKEVQHG